MSVVSSLEQFAATHRVHGPICSGANELAPNGYRAWAVCPCLAIWSRWVTDAEASVEMLKTDFPALAN